MFLSKLKRNALSSLVIGAFIVASVSGSHAQELKRLSHPVPTSLGPGWHNVSVEPMALEEWEKYVKERDSRLQSPSSVKTAKSSGVFAKAAFASPNDFTALAEALENDPLRIYQYVRNHFEYVPYYGVKKGPYLTLHERSGNDFDQAALLIELLHAAGFTDAKFRYGTIQVSAPQDRVNMASWLGTDNDIQIMAQTLASGGLPVVANATIVQFEHIWVEVTVGGSLRSLDPSFKPTTKFSTIDLDAAMDFTEAGVLSAATQGATTTAISIKDMNESGLAGYLSARSTDLQDYIKLNHPNDTVEEVIGGYRIEQDTSSALPTTLPLPVVSMEPTSWATIDPIYISTIRIKHGGIDKTFQFPEIAGRKLSLNYEGGNDVAKLYVDDVLAADEVSPSGDLTKLEVFIDHPYPNGFGDFNNVNDPYIVERTGSYVFASGFGGDRHSTLLGERQRRLNRMSIDGTAVGSRQNLSEVLNVMGLNWMQQTQLSADLLYATTGQRRIVHHRFGLVRQQDGYALDIATQFSSNPARIAAPEPGSFASHSLMQSAFEHSTLEQSQGASNPALSTIKVIALNNANGDRLFLANNGTYPNVELELDGYSPQQEASFASQVGQGFRLLIPENGAVELLDWTGLGYARYFVNQGVPAQAGMILGGNLNGGDSAQIGQASRVPLQTESFSESLHPSNIQQNTSFDPVSLATGAFLAGGTDIALGGAGPRGLSFGRSYNSQQVTQNKVGLGRGWTHNYDISLAQHSDADSALGLRTPFDAIPFIVANHIARTLTEPVQPSVTNWGVSALTANWAMEQLLDKTVTVNVGSRASSYRELPDGSFVAPPGVTTELVRLGGGTYELRERFDAVMSFNGNDQIQSLTDADGNTLSFTYSGTQLNQVQDAFNRTLTLAYSSGELDSVTDSTGRVVSYNYTGDDLTGVTGLETAQWAYSYDSLHRMETITDPELIQMVDNTYDDFDRVVEQTLPRQTGTAMHKLHYAGFLSSEEYPDGGRMTYHYDVNGRTVAIENALGHKNATEYDGQGHAIAYADTKGQQSTFVYDGNQNLIESRNPLNHKTTIEHDAQFRIIGVTDPLLHESETDYDAEHHPIASRDALGNESTTSYRPDGLVSSVTDARSVTTAYLYDSNGHPTSVKTGTHPAVLTNYDVIGRMSDLTDQAGAQTQLSYDDRGLTETIIDPLNETSTSVYDDLGRMETGTDRNGDIVTATYTPTSKLNSITYPARTAVGGGVSGFTVSFTYDAKDLVTAMVDQHGTTTNNYDLAGRLVDHTDSNGHQVQYEYDELGNLIELTYPDGKTVSYQYDSANRRTGITIDWLSKTATPSYDDAGLITSITNFNGTTSSYLYDDANRLTDLKHFTGVNTPLVDYSFMLDPGGNRIQATITGELAKPGGLIDSVQSQTYNPKKNRLVSAVTSEPITFSYDDEGQAETVLGTVTNKTYDFDSAHRLVGYSNGAYTATYKYDGAGNRLSATRQGVKTQYIHDAGGSLLAEADAGGTIIRYYIHGTGLMAFVDAVSGQLYVYHHDSTGHTIAVTNAGQAIENSYAYSAYGQLMAKNENVSQPYTYAGQAGIYTEAENLYYMRARYYDAEVGRFISEDPAGFAGGLNLYAYVGGNPISFIDPSGLGAENAQNGQRNAMGLTPDAMKMLRGVGGLAIATASGVACILAEPCGIGVLGVGGIALGGGLAANEMIDGATGMASRDGSGGFNMLENSLPNEVVTSLEVVDLLANPAKNVTDLVINGPAQAPSLMRKAETWWDVTRMGIYADSKQD